MDHTETSRRSSSAAGESQLTGTSYGSSGSWQNQGNTFRRAVDGNINTYNLTDRLPMGTTSESIRKSLADLRPEPDLSATFQSATSNLVYTQPLLSMALGTRNVRRDVLGWWTVQLQPNQASSVS